MEWSKTYGPILRFKIAGRNVVVLNDFNSIKKFLCKREILYRASNLVFRQAGVVGLTSINEKKWEDNRRFSLHVLRDLGFGKVPMEENIKAECQWLVEKIADTKEAPVMLGTYATPSMSNNITAIVFGRRLQFDDPERKFLDEKLTELLVGLTSGPLLNFLPTFINDITAKFCFTREARLRSTFKGFKDFVRDRVSEHKDTLEENSTRDYIDGYLKKIQQHEHNPDSSYQTHTLVGNVINFFGAGSNSVLITLQWLLLKCAQDRDTLQSHIQREIDAHIGRERQPCWKDHHRMPFTTAAIWEMHRWRTIVPLSFPREAGSDTYFDDYFIPKGTVIMPNIHAVHMDHNLWQDPEVFNPSRFLSQDGSRLLPLPEHLIPFSIGKRMCPAYRLAAVEVFLYLTTILQKFSVLPEEGKAISMEPSFSTGAVVSSRDQKLRFLGRF